MIKGDGIPVVFEERMGRREASVGYVRIGATGMRGMTERREVNRVRVPFSSHNGWLLLERGTKECGDQRAGLSRTHKDGGVG